jgi:hypothetical protein
MRQGTLAYGDVQTQPGGRAMALEVSRASEPPDVVLVRGNGSFVTIARSARLLLSVDLGGVG